MYVVNPLDLVDSAILQALARSPRQSVAELYKAVKKSYGVKQSLANFYRRIAILTSAQMIVNVGGKLSLSRVWLVQLQEFVQGALSTHSVTDEKRKLIAVEGSRTYTADSLFSLDPVWNDVLMQLAEEVPEKRWYVFNSHPWYSLAMLETDRRLMESLNAKGISIRLLFGGNSFLDRYGCKLTKAKGLRCVAAAESFFPAEGFAAWVCGDYVVEVSFPEAIAKHFAMFFRTVHAIEEFDVGLFKSLLKTRMRCKLRLLLDPKKAIKYRQVIANHF